MIGYPWDAQSQLYECTETVFIPESLLMRTHIAAELAGGEIPAFQRALCHSGREYRTVERQVNALTGEGIKEPCRVSDKQNTIVLGTRRALGHRARHQELFGT